MSKKTIKELAEEIGVSKTAISKKVTETQKKKWFTKIGNQFVISEEGQKVIKSMFISDKKTNRKLISKLVSEITKTKFTTHISIKNSF